MFEPDVPFDEVMGAPDTRNNWNPEAVALG